MITDMNAVPQRTDGQAMPAPTGGPNQPAQPNLSADTSAVQQASPEEQAQYERFIDAAQRLIYRGGKVNPQIIDMLDGGKGEGTDGNPEDGLAQVAAMVIGRVAGAAEKDGTQLPPDVVYHAGIEVFEDLAHVSKLAGIKDYDADKQSMHRAFYKALDTFQGMLKGAGEIDQQSAQADMQKLQQMDQQGVLDPLFNKLAADDENAGGDGSAPPRQRVGMGG